MNNKIINWGIIGCGNVTEVKSGPAFNLANNSRLVAVMRRTCKLAEDYAHRHNVPKWYDNVDELLGNNKSPGNGYTGAQTNKVIDWIFSR